MPEPKEGQGMDFETIERLIHLLEESSIDQLEVEEEGLRVRLQKQGQAPAPAGYALAPQPPAAAPAAVAAEAATGGPPPGTKPIEAPMVGTFYRAPSPDAAPYVEVGDTVSEETVVCILEAMKVMNEIKAGVRGTVAEVLAENAQPVEFGQPLFLVKPSGV
jgi:acetyl-CoA carboxylase biotin carboxyl carrier protein